jgi:sodium transport system permease protein
LGKWPAILATAFLFGLAHASIYRLLPTLTLGILFGLVVWKTRSLATGIICHALNNGLMATLARSKTFLSDLGFSGAKFVPWPVIAVGAVICAAGLWLVLGDGESQSETTA